MGGLQPVSGATIQVYAASTRGLGTSATQILTVKVATSASGSFTLPQKFKCINPSDQIYVIATGGNSGGSTNSSLALMTDLGTCSNLQPSTTVYINEVTTVASVYALTNFMNPSTFDVASSSSDAPLVAAAYTNAGAIANLSNGTGISSTPVYAKLNSLADSIAACVNATSGSTVCQSLFNAAAPAGGVAPANTVAALLNIARNPTNNVQAIYNLSSGQPFQPTLVASPADWILFTSSRITPPPTPATPVIKWPAPAPVTYGTALSAAQLDATASVPGTFVYSPAIGSIPAAGTDTLSVIFTPTDTANYTTARATVNLLVNKATPTITWATPAAITQGTALSSAQLNATASVPGAFVYNPAAGAVLSAGSDTLAVTFTPTDSTNYSTATASVILSVTGGTTGSVTNIAVGGAAQTGVKRLGMNIGGQDYWDSSQMLKNLVFRNPGFEGEIWESILKCGSATATSCTDIGTWAQWPDNFMQGASFEFIYGSAAGQTGTVSSSTAAASDHSHGVTINFTALSKAPSAGDFVIVKKGLAGNPQAGWWTNLSGGAALTTETSDLSPNTVGKQALRVTAASGAASVTSYFDTVPGRSFIQMKGNYTLSFRAKGLGGTNQVAVTFQRSGTPFFSQTISLGSSWQDYSFTVATSENGSAVGTVKLDFTFNGSNALLDDVSLTPANSTNSTTFRDEVVSTLKSMNPSVLRWNDGANTGSTIDNIIAPAFARQRAGASTSSTVYEDVALGLHEFLQLCQAVGAEPYYNMPPAISPTEMKNLIEYLGGDSSTTYGAKRTALGQASPWTSVFPVIHLELGNEQWNYDTFPGSSINDPTAYGQRVATIFGAAKSSPSYNSSSFDLVMGAQAVNTSSTAQELSSGSNYDSVAVAPYIFNNLNDTSSDEAIFGPMFAQPEMVDSVSSGYMYKQAQQVKAAGKKVVIYEVNLSTLTGNANQSTVNSVVASLGSGLTLAEHMLLMIRDLGITTQNLWELPGYNNGFYNPSSSGETTPLFGSVIDMGGPTNLRRPTFLATQLANTAILPTILTTTQSGANPTWNQALSSNDSIQLSGAHEIQSFAFSDGGTNRSLVVFNLSRTSSLPVTFSGSSVPSGTVNVGQLTSANLTDNNETSSSVSIATSSVSNFQAATPYSLPPYSMTVFTWLQ